jgi:hypothetical protein
VLRRLVLATLTFALAAATASAQGAGPSLIPIPSAVVYPFTANDSVVDRETGSRLANAMAGRIGDGGGVKVLPPKPGIERKDYLEEARRAGADYYVMGLAADVGTGMSLVVQVVSAQNGIVIFGTSAQVRTLNDAAAVGDILRTGIIRHATRSMAAYEAMPASAPASPVPAASPAGRVGAVALLPLTGTAEGALREATQRALAQRLERGGVHAVLLSADQAPAAACSAGGNAGGVVSGTLDLRTESRSSTAMLRLVARDCSGTVVYDQTFTRTAGGAQAADTAAERVTDAAAGDYLRPSSKKR